MRPADMFRRPFRFVVSDRSGDGAGATRRATVSVVLAYIVCAVVWGTTWFAIRVCIGPGGFPTYAAAALRLLLAAGILVGLWAVGLARPGPRNRRAVGWLVIAGLFNALGYGLIYRAEQHIPGGLACVVSATMPVVTAVVAVVTRTERISLRSALGSLLGLAGIGVIFADRLQVSAEQATAVVLVLGSVVTSSIYTVVLKRQPSGQHPLAATAVFFLASGSALAVFAAAVERTPLPWPLPLRPTLALAYLVVVGSVIVFACYVYLVERLTLMQVTTLVFVQPLIALGVDAVFERDVRLVPRTYLGVAITIAGVLLTVLLRTVRPARSLAAAAD